MLARNAGAIDVVLILTLFLTGCGVNSNGPETTLPTQGEKPPPEMLNNLGEETEFMGYLVRPPKGYFKDAPPGSAALKAVAWGGKPRDDGSYSLFMITITTKPSNEIAPDLHAVLAEVLDNMKQWREDCTETKAEEIEINGLKFLRCRWTGTEPRRQWKMHGFTALAKDGSKIIHITGQDVEPNHEQRLKIAEAALLTFRKK